MIYLFMVGMILFFVGLALAPVLQDVTNENTHNEQLNCSAENLTKEDQSACTSMDLFNPYFIGIVFGIAGLLIGRVVIQ